MVRLEGASLGELCVRWVVKRHIRPHPNMLQYQYPKAHGHIMHLMEFEDVWLCTFNTKLGPNFPK